MNLTVILAALLLGGCDAFVVQNNPLRSQTQISASKGPGNIKRVPNEFSRNYLTERVLGNKYRDYQVSIDASDEERAELAKRFDLSNISKLEAELVMRREPGIKGTSNRGKACFVIKLMLLLCLLISPISFRSNGRCGGRHGDSRGHANVCAN